MNFSSDVAHNPLRMNLFTAHGRTFVVDYAHNAASYRAILDTARTLGGRELVLAASAPGDRTDESIREIGRVCGELADRAFFYPMRDRRGRGPDDIPRLMHEGAAQVRSADRLATCNGVHDAVRQALAGTSPGDLIVIGCTDSLDDLTGAVSEAVEIAASAPGPCELQRFTAPEMPQTIAADASRSPASAPAAVSLEPQT